MARVEGYAGLALRRAGNQERAAAAEEVKIIS